MRVRPHTNPFSIQTEHTFEGFGNTKPIIVDVGSCKGEFALALLKEFQTTKNFILFEIRKPLYLKLCEIFSEYDNVVVFDGDAGKNFANILQPCLNEGASVEEVFINFPDPWIKARHHKRRFINTEFLNNTAQWIKEDTAFIFQTDQKSLFDNTYEILMDSPFSQIEYFDKSPHGAITEWESVKMRENMPLYRMQFSL